MATFESKFGLGDHVWQVVGPCDWDEVEWHIFESIINEVQFSECLCSRVWYQLRGVDDPLRESELFGSLEEAVNSLPAEAKAYFLVRTDEEGHENEGVKVEINHP